MHQITPKNQHELIAPCAAEWMQKNPIVLRVSGGRVYKKDICRATSITKWSWRLRLAPILDSNDDFRIMYEKFKDAKYVSIAVAEVLVKEMFDNDPNLDIQFEKDTYSLDIAKRGR